MVGKQTTTAMPVRVWGAAAMSTYHLHARILVGPLAATDRDEVRISETGSWDDAQAWSREQLADGFTVWIYDHGHVTPITGASDYRVIAHERPVSIHSARPRRRDAVALRALTRPRVGRLRTGAAVIPPELG